MLKVQGRRSKLEGGEDPRRGPLPGRALCYFRRDPPRGAKNHEVPQRFGAAKSRGGVEAAQERHSANPARCAERRRVVLTDRAGWVAATLWCASAAEIDRLIESKATGPTWLHFAPYGGAADLPS